MSEESLKQIAARRSELTGWQSPKDFVAKVEELARQVKSNNLFNDPSVGFLLDAIPIAEFTNFRSTEKVRLTDQKEQWPDGLIGTPTQPVNVEVTEVQEEGRKRGDEYRSSGEAKGDGTADDWRKRAEAIPGRLEQAIEQKRAKGNMKDSILLVYLNMSTYGVLQEETEEAIKQIKEKYASDFGEICVLWQGKLL